MVGGSIGLSVGGALCAQAAGKGHVGVALFGDGVLDEGISYEAMNIAALFQLPVLFLCENNARRASRKPRGSRPSELTAVPKRAAASSARP